MKKLIVDSSSFLTNQEQTNAETNLKALLDVLRTKSVSLSKDDRVKLRKMGSRRLAYVEATEEASSAYERFLPRDMNAADMTILLQEHRKMRSLFLLLEELNEALNDQLMALGIDLMLYTKSTHDALRSANHREPALDAVLDRLDEFNAKAEAEDAETPPPTEEKK